MAIDAIECYIYNVNNIKDKLFINELSGWKFTLNTDNEHLSSYNICINGIYLRYKPYSHKGKLSMKFNVPKLITGDNISSVFCCNIQRLFEILQDNLSSIINLKEAPHLRFWKVSKFENNINIIRNKDIIISLYSFLSKIDKTNNFYIHRIYENKGTIYFGNGKDLNSSTILVKFYFKLRQIEQTTPTINIMDYYESNIINLSPCEDILRLEILTKRDKITKLFNPTILYSSNPEYYEKNKTKTIDKNIGAFEDIMNYDFQIIMLNNIIKEFNINKIITTKSNLFRVINNSKDLSLSEKKTAKAVVNTLNLKDKYHKKKPSTSSIYKYRKWILDNGYHYIYSDKEISPIILEEIVENLPKQQQIAIQVYKDSNIFKDLYC